MTHSPRPVPAAESVAGEEDPGASLDMVYRPPPAAVAPAAAPHDGGLPANAVPPAQPRAPHGE